MSRAIASTVSSWKTSRKVPPLFPPLEVEPLVHAVDLDQLREPARVLDDVRAVPLESAPPERMAVQHLVVRRPHLHGDDSLELRERERLHRVVGRIDHSRVRAVPV